MKKKDRVKLSDRFAIYNLFSCTLMYKHSYLFVAVHSSHCINFTREFLAVQNFIIFSQK